MASVWDQTQYRFRSDDGNETTATWLAATNTNVTVACAADRVVRVRFTVERTGKGSESFTGYLRCSKNGGAFAQVTGATSSVHATAASSISDGDPTTQQLTGSGTFAAGRFDSGDGASDASDSMSSGFNTEHEFCLLLVSADLSNGDTLDFELYKMSGDGAALDSYTSGAGRITVSKAEEHSGTGTLTDTPSLSSTGRKGGAGAGGTLTDAANLTDAGTKAGAGSGALSTSAALSQTGQKAGAGTGTLSATASFASTGIASVPIMLSAVFAYTGKKAGLGAGVLVCTEAFTSLHEATFNLDFAPVGGMSHQFPFAKKKPRAVAIGRR